ncbi:MAG: hypothetical protein HRT38_08110 [Alteromonadaceae bacterium]|nr:hypothetical protein [Alteromonadaceae bacterium]
MPPNHFALINGDAIFDTTGTTAASFTLANTTGCSCEQIVEKQGLGKGHLKNGCSAGVMIVWIDKVKPHKLRFYQAGFSLLLWSPV